MSTVGIVRSFITGKLSLVKPNDPVAGRVWQVVAHARYFIVRNDPYRWLWSPKTSGRPNQRSPKTGYTVLTYFYSFNNYLLKKSVMHFCLSAAASLTLCSSTIACTLTMPSTSRRSTFIRWSKLRTVLFVGIAWKNSNRTKYAISKTNVMEAFRWCNHVVRSTRSEILVTVTRRQHENVSARSKVSDASDFGLQCPRKSRHLLTLSVNTRCWQPTNDCPRPR